MRVSKYREIFRVFCSCIDYQGTDHSRKSISMELDWNEFMQSRQEFFEQILFMRMPFCRVIRLLQWVDYDFLCPLFEWGRISRNWHVKKFSCLVRRKWFELGLYGWTRVRFMFPRCNPLATKMGLMMIVTFDFICYTKICIDMDYVCWKYRYEQTTKAIKYLASR